MPINEADLQRLQKLVPKLMRIADTLDATWEWSKNDVIQQDLRWLSEQLPRLLEEREQARAFLDEANENLQLNALSVQKFYKETLALTEQLEQAQAEMERLRQFAELVTKLNDRGGLEPASLWHVIEMAKQALNSQENK